jgi:mono/diheme cytochrome c family protein
MKSTILIAVAAVGMAATLAQAQESKLPPAATKENLTYVTDIKPIFDASCVKCHTGDRPKARLHMDTLEGVLKGTGHGKIVTPGAPEKSFIVKSIAHLTKDSEGWMPPPHNKAGIKPLTQDEIALIEGWIKQGAK